MLDTVSGIFKNSDKLVVPARPWEDRVIMKLKIGTESVEVFIFDCEERSTGT